MVETIKNGDLVTIFFSKDRPIQLDLALNSNNIVSEVPFDNNCFVLYDTSHEIFENSYKSLKNSYKNYIFLKQRDFKKDLLSLLSGKKYVMLSVDDCIFTKEYNLYKICNALNIFEGSLGFSLRLGKNTTYCYSLNIQNDVPYIERVFEDICAFNWLSSKQGDFNYPLEVSSSIYRVETLLPILENCQYNSPNSLEWAMATNLHLFTNQPYLNCFETSVAFCNPVNKIQNENNNRAWDKPEYSIENLLEKYIKGYRISFSAFYWFVSNACHQEVDFTFFKEINNEAFN